MTAQAGSATSRIGSVCVFCGSSDDADPAFLTAANQFGALLADHGLKLVYGGGGVGLMGACARGASKAGGAVLGIIPAFLTSRERQFDEVETVVVENMHDRKIRMFNAADAFVVLPGGVGTLEEVVELLSWQRLDLHRKPVVFYNPRDFWQPLFDLFYHTITERLTPASFAQAWRATDRLEEIIPLIETMSKEPGSGHAAPDANRLA
jgi:uncharacterized protein (TIGR00730 family)